MMICPKQTELTSEEHSISGQIAALKSFWLKQTELTSEEHPISGQIAALKIVLVEADGADL